MHNGLENLVNLQASAEGDGRLSPTVQSWLADALRQYTEEEDLSLEKALDLNGAPGQRKAKTLFKESIRNRMLLEAWSMVTSEAVSPWKQSELLHEAMSRFEVSSYRAYKQYENPPDRFTPLQKLLFRIYKNGTPLPATARGLHGLIMRICENH